MNLSDLFGGGLENTPVAVWNGSGIITDSIITTSPAIVVGYEFGSSFVGSTNLYAYIKNGAQTNANATLQFFGYQSLQHSQQFTWPVEFADGIRVSTVGSSTIIVRVHYRLL